MKNYRKHIDDFFREKLGNYTETPPPDVWDNLSDRLDGLQTPPGFTGRYLWHAAIVSLLLVMGVSLFRKSTDNQSSANIAQSQPPASGKTVDNSAPGNSAVANKLENDTNPNATGADVKSTTPEQRANTNSNTGGQAATTSGVKKSSHPSPVNRNRKASGNQSGTGSGNQFAAGTANGLETSVKSEGDKDDAGTLSSDAGTGPNVPNIVLKTDAKPTVAAGKKADPTPVKASSKDKKILPEIGRFDRFEMGVKAGYEGGFNQDAARKMVVSPYLQYNITRKLSVLTQPAIKSATISGTSIGKPQSYYQSNDPGHSKLNYDSLVISGIGIAPDTTHYTNYTYYQNHDSIVKSYSYGGTYMEFEIPLLLKYKINNRFSAFGGVSINYSRLVSLHVNTFSKNNISDSASAFSISNSGIASPLPITTVLKYPGYTNSDVYTPVYASPQGNIVRVGVMVGFSYECSKRWLFDGLLQQSPVKPDVQGGYNLNAPFSSTYFRLSVGYKLIN